MTANPPRPVPGPREPLYRFCSFERADEDADKREVTFVASDESVDRYGDVILADGWDLANFRKNPILLWMHSQAAPIGQVPRLWVEDRALMARVKFAPEGLDPTADRIWQLVRARILRAASVGFNVASDEDWEYIRDDKNDAITGYLFKKAELLELSIVSVPANPASLATARALGMSEPFIRSVLPLDASVIKAQHEARRRLLAARIGGLRHYTPR